GQQAPAPIRLIRKQIEGFPRLLPRLHPQPNQERLWIPACPASNRVTRQALRGFLCVRLMDKSRSAEIEAMNRYIRFSLACVIVLAPMALHSQTSGAFLGGLLTNRTVELPDSSRARLKTIDYLEAPLFELNSGLNRVISDPFMEQRVR